MTVQQLRKIHNPRTALYLNAKIALAAVAAGAIIGLNVDSVFCSFDRLSGEYLDTDDVIFPCAEFCFCQSVLVLTVEAQELNKCVFGDIQ